MFFAVSVLVVPCAVGRDARYDWGFCDTLTTRLGAEREALSGFDDDLSDQAGIMADLREAELFPPDVLGGGGDALIALDRKLDECEKTHRALRKMAASFAPGLTEGLEILREMAADRPVADMLAVMDKDDGRRAADLRKAGQRIDGFWSDIGAALSLFAKAASCDGSVPAGLSANRAERCDAVLGAIKDSLAARAGDDQARRMYRIEMSGVRKNIKSLHGRPVAAKLEALRGRYRGKPYAGELDFLLAKALFSQGAYDGACAAARLAADSARFKTSSLLIRLQSLYALGRYDSLWNWGKQNRFETLKGSARNLALWMVMESGLAVGAAAPYPAIASLVEKDSSYSPHVMHALARSYAAAKQYDMALSVLDGAARFPAPSAVDGQARKRIRLTTAEILYEKGDYEKALSLFVAIANTDDEAVFARAMYGISWCYIRLGMYRMADASLRKLINQDPRSPYAVRALLTMGRRYLGRAQYEWERLSYLADAENRFALMRKAVEEKAAAPAQATRDKAARVLARLDEIVSKLIKERHESDAGVARLYGDAAATGGLIQRYYAAGTFTETPLTETRERLLHRIDSLLMALKGTDPVPAERIFEAEPDAADIKKLVLKGRVFSAEVALDRFRWERERLDRRTNQASRTADSVSTRKRAAAEAAVEGGMDSLAGEENLLFKKWYGPLTELCDSLTALGLDTADDVYLRYHAAELHYRREAGAYASAYAAYEAARAKYDSQTTLFRQGKAAAMPVPPAAPAPDHDSSMAQYRYLMRKYPNAALDYAVRYSLAWCYIDLSKPDSAEALMESVARRYPSCQYAPEAEMYVGEYMFDRARLDEALAAYKAVLDHPESDWFDKALYKLAWTQYRLSNPGKAISSFLGLVNLGKTDTSGSILEKESIDYIAMSFAETDAAGEGGLARAAEFVTRFGDPERGARILHRLALIYKEQGRLDMSRKTYRAVLSLYPEYRESPLIESELLADIEKDDAAESASRRDMEFFGKYNRGGEWSKGQTDPVVIARADSLAQNRLYDAAIRYHRIAFRKNDTNQYGLAAESYRKFVGEYPESERAVECRFNLAEILFTLGDFRHAAEEYMAVAKSSPRSRYADAAARNAVAASQNLLKQEAGERK
jgi:TolA-binding protein